MKLEAIDATKSVLKGRNHMSELLAIKSNLAFRAVFGREEVKCKRALTLLLNAILDLNIEQITYGNPLNFQEYVDDKQSEMDIEIITDRGQRMDIEIQLQKTAGFKERIIYYGAKLLNDALQEGQDYGLMKQCKVISILDFRLFNQNQRFSNRFKYQETKDHYTLSDISELIFLEMPKLEEKPVQEMCELEKWLNFLKYAGNPAKETLLQQLIKESEGVNMAYQVLDQVSADEMMRIKIKYAEKTERDRASYIIQARLEGIEEGMEKGIEKGMEKGKTENIIGLLPILDDETISSALNVPLEKVKALRAEYQSV